MTSSYVNAFSVDSREVVLVDRAGGYESPPRLERVLVDWSCFVRTPLPRDLFRELKTTPSVRSIQMQKGAFYRINWTDRVACRAGSEFLESRGIRTYEGNVDPLTRLLVERDVAPRRPRSLYLDLETDPRPGLFNKTKMRILVAGLVDFDTGDADALVLDEDTDEAERRLLLALWKRLESYDQVIAWNGDRFDEPVLVARTRKHKVPVEPRRILWLDAMQVYEKQNAAAAASGDEKDSYAIDSVCQALGIPGKKSLDARKAYEYWSAGGERRDELVEYCVHDTTRMPAIEKKTGYLELFRTLCESTGVFASSRNIGPSYQVESFLLRLARDRGHRFPSRFSEELDEEDLTDAERFAKKKVEQFRGALVLKPSVSGIQRDVHVVDFARMYPSIIRSLNLSPETKVEQPDLLSAFPLYLRGSPAYQRVVEETRSRRPPPDCAVTPTGSWFRQNPLGILPLAVERLLELRKYWDEKKASEVPGTPGWKEADRRSSAYKIAVNAFYGVVGQRSSMFFDVDVAESTTQTGVKLIRAVVDEAEKNWLMRSVYSDTDGSYLVDTTTEKTRDFVADCNDDLFPRMISEMGGRCFIKIEYEKAFKRLVFSWNEREHRSSAKKYAAKLLMFKGKQATEESRPEVKGLALKRGDSLRLAREMQREVIEELIVREQDDPFRFDEMVARWKTLVLEGELPHSDVKYSQAITQSLGEYSRRAKKEAIDLGPAECVGVGPKGLVFESAFLSLLGSRKLLLVPVDDFHERSPLFRRTGDPAHLKQVVGWSGNLLVNDYVAGPTHVRVAKILEAMGIPVRSGEKVEYVITDASRSPIEVVPYDAWDGVTIDRVDLWAKVWTPSKLLLWGAFPDVDWKRFDVSYPKRERAPRPVKAPKQSRKKPELGQGELAFLGGSK